jgi:hypothetical protein
MLANNTKIGPKADTLLNDSTVIRLLISYTVFLLLAGVAVFVKQPSNMLVPLGLVALNLALSLVGIFKIHQTKLPTLLICFLVLIVRNL